MKFLTALQQALLEFALSEPNSMILGEDIEMPYAGAFKATKLVAKNCSKHVMNTPISEAGAVGVGIGMAIRGCPTIIEIMFGDFLTLIVDQIINHAAKFHTVSGGKLSVPLIIRTPVGAGRGYGIVHSQSLEKIFLGISGLVVIAPSIYHCPKKLLMNSIKLNTPVLFLEHKALYSQQLCAGEEFTDNTKFPVMHVTNTNNHVDVVFVCYGGITAIIKDVLNELQMEEIWATAIIPSLISDTEHCAKEISSNKKYNNKTIIVIDEATEEFGWSVQLAYSLIINKVPQQKIKILSREVDIIPASISLENELIITKDTILEFTYKILGV